jgi:hypothetical protein
LDAKTGHLNLVVFGGGLKTWALTPAVATAGIVVLAVAAEGAGVAAKAVGELESVENMTVAR